ncbi:mesothelin-like protein [Limanda limanda]|uniref:mesothelin-like protein n=1 Tax=Limanda limanda TaxID=27771 RepID=UPI0029C6E330|nr:mesothelin-like protein [Limanda limanda]
MYNYIKGDSDATSFALYPSDVLLYYDYSLVPQSSCRSYFEQLADADFTVFSSDLSYKRTALFDNARSCLGITTTNLTKDNIIVLGNMCCSVDGSYIENSDPSILETLKNCPDLTTSQASAAQSLLLSGETPYGATSTWDQQTLQDLGMLPLYMTSTFYAKFDKKTKRKFLKYFLKVLKSNGVSRQKRRTMKKQIRKSNRKNSKRSIESECTSGTITHVAISKETFPFDYDDVTQFNCCLSAATVKGNLEELTEKVDDEEFLAIILFKLHEAYPDTTIPEDQVQMLGPASRVATASHISKWRITEVDTLYALMDSSDGDWDTSLAKAVISNYLSNAGNALGSAELNTIGGANLCALDVDVLKNISAQSLKEANALDVSTCTTEKKEELFTIAIQAFTTTTRSTTVPLTTYQLTAAYLGGSTSAYIQSLVNSNVSMDVPTFTTLNESIVTDLTVSNVQGLLGSNVADLKSYENQTVVKAWTRSRLQSDLDTMSLGLTGGRATTSTTTPNPTTATTVSSSASSSASPTSSVATTSSSPTSSVATTPSQQPHQ